MPLNIKGEPDMLSYMGMALAVHGIILFCSTHILRIYRIGMP